MTIKDKEKDLSNQKVTVEEMKDTFKEAMVKDEKSKNTKNKKEILNNKNKNNKLSEHIENLGKTSETFINTMLKQTESYKLWESKVKELSELEKNLVESMNEFDNYLILSDKYIQLINTFIKKGYLDTIYAEKSKEALKEKNMLFLQEVYKQIQSSLLMETPVTIVVDNDEMTIFLSKDRNRFINRTTNETQYMEKHGEFKLTYQDSIQDFTSVNGNKDILEDIELIVFPKQHNYMRTIKTLVLNPQMLIELVDLINKTQLTNTSIRVSNALDKEPMDMFGFNVDDVSLAVFKSNKVVYKHPQEVLQTLPNDTIERIIYRDLLANKQATALIKGILYVKNISFNGKSTDMYELVNMIERFKVKGKSLQKLLPNSYNDNERIIISEKSLVELAKNITKFIIPVSGA